MTKKKGQKDIISQIHTNINAMSLTLIYFGLKERQVNVWIESMSGYCCVWLQGGVLNEKFSGVLNTFLGVPDQ